MEYKVDWCKHCNQGWILIKKNAVNNNLFFYCTEDEKEWRNWEDYQNLEPFDLFHNDKPIDPTYDDIINQEWEKYLLSQEQIDNPCLRPSSR